MEHPFCEDFTDALLEDTELGYRLAQKGMQLHFHPPAVAHHDHPTSILAFSRRSRRFGQVSRLLIRKHPELATVFRGQSVVQRLCGLRTIAKLCTPLADFVDRRLRMPMPNQVYRAILAAHYADGLLSDLPSGSRPAVRCALTTLLS